MALENGSFDGVEALIFDVFGYPLHTQTNEQERWWIGGDR
jgi:hypothetical protein